MAIAVASIPSSSVTQQKMMKDPELGEQTPLIATPTNDGDDDETPLRDIREGYTRREKAVAGLSTVSFVTSALGMILYPNILVYISGTIGCAVAPYVAIQQQKITHVQALAETNERVQEEVEQLKGENVKLQTQVEELSSSIKNLKIQKEKLDTLQSVQGASLDKLERQLQESRNIYNRMKSNLQGEILNNLIDIALACDEDQDMMLSDEEIDGAITRLESIHGIDVDNEGVRKAIIQNGRSLDAIMGVIKNLLRDDIPLDENLFRSANVKS